MKKLIWSAMVVAGLVNSAEGSGKKKMVAPKPVTETGTFGPLAGNAGGLDAVDPGVQYLKEAEQKAWAAFGAAVADTEDVNKGNPLKRTTDRDSLLALLVTKCGKADNARVNAMLSTEYIMSDEELQECSGLDNVDQSKICDALSAARISKDSRVASCAAEMKHLFDAATTKNGRLALVKGIRNLRTRTLVGLEALKPLIWDGQSGRSEVSFTQLRIGCGLVDVLDDAYAETIGGALWAAHAAAGKAWQDLHDGLGCAEVELAAKKK